MKYYVVFVMAFVIGLLLCAVIAHSNTLTWSDNSSIESGFSVEMLSGGNWKEVGRVSANVSTFVDAFTEGVYRVRAFLVVAGQADVFSAYSNTAVKLDGPVNANVK